MFDGGLLSVNGGAAADDYDVWERVTSARRRGEGEDGECMERQTGLA